MIFIPKVGFQMFTSHDLLELTEFRRELHQHPELSRQEEKTAERIDKALKKLNPTKIITGLGGHGVAAIFDSNQSGPTVLFRAELDALPIQEKNNIAWASNTSGVSHVCGHDGHMVMLLALGRLISRKPFAIGRVILMFQPAEEDGSGARAVVSEPNYLTIKPDWAFAIHIEPGRPFGYVSTCPGLINCASLGLKIKLSGKTAHAADPNNGISPSNAVARLLPELENLGHGEILNDNFRQATVTHVKIGEASFGVAPGEAMIFLTLRTSNNKNLSHLKKDACNLVSFIAEEYGLKVNFEVLDHFAASINDKDAYKIAVNAMDALDIPHGSNGLPMRASEDFGVFGIQSKAVMLCLGPGENYPALHNPNYDFNDDLIPIGSKIFEQITRDLLGTA